MPILEIYTDIDTIPSTTDSVISPGRQLSVGHSLEDASVQPFSLSPMSRLNVLAGAMVAEATQADLYVTGNERASYPLGAGQLLAERYPDIHPILEVNSPTALASARNIAPILRQMIRTSGLVEVVIASDETQGVRLADMFKDQRIPVRGIAVAHRIVRSSVLPEDRMLATAYEHDRYRRLEDMKQRGLRALDPHGTRIEGIARLVRP